MFHNKVWVPSPVFIRTPPDHHYVPPKFGSLIQQLFRFIYVLDLVSFKISRNTSLLLLVRARKPIPPADRICPTCCCQLNRTARIRPLPVCTKCCRRCSTPVISGNFVRPSFIWAQELMSNTHFAIIHTTRQNCMIAKVLFSEKGFLSKLYNSKLYLGTTPYPLLNYLQNPHKLYNCQTTFFFENILSRHFRVGVTKLPRISSFQVSNVNIWWHHSSWVWLHLCPDDSFKTTGGSTKKHMYHYRCFSWVRASLWLHL
jgi:hypothetical protein